MRVTDLEPRDLPRLRGRDAAAMTQAARVLARFASRTELSLGALGTLSLARAGVEALAPTLAGEAAGDVVLGLSRGGVEGRIVIEGGLARRAVALALGVETRPGAPLARLGLAERGVVAGLVASVLQATGAPFSVALVAPGTAAIATDGGAAVGIRATVGGVEGWARLELPARWLAALAPSAAGPVGPLEAEARVELARTRLSAGELAGLVVGDAVVFDGAPAFAAGGERVVRVVIGAHAALARRSGDGRVTLEEELRQAPAPSGRGRLGQRRPEEVTMDERSGDETTTRTVDVAAVLAAAPIEVVAELGRVVLRGEEIAGLGPGSVLAFGRLGASPVALRVGDEIWAEGELVDVDGELGVRVTALRRAR
ncbi:MAG TPA: FliM/FliN family flagellar motor switch protein [Polyangia bacterium]|nr:FliM/FliN family flagellar motor switch protein [Polyangia bacterium]